MFTFIAVKGIVKWVVLWLLGPPDNTLSSCIHKKIAELRTN